MANDATRDAKLVLKFETAEAIRGMKDVERAGEKVADTQKDIAEEAAKATKAIVDQARAAEAAARTIEKYGNNELRTPDTPGAKRFQRGLDKRHDAAQKAVDDYRLAKHYETLRKQRADQAQGVAKQQAEAAAAAEERSSLLKSESERHAGLRDARFSDRIGGRMAGLGAGGMGALGKAGIAGLVASLSIGAVKKGLDFASDTTTQRDDLTGAQKFNHVLGALTMGVSTSLINFRNAMDGTTEGMRRAARNLQDMETRAQIRAQNRAEIAGMQSGVDQARARSQSLAGASAPVMPSFDRWTMAGQQAYEEYQTVTPAMDAAAAAEREARGARMAERSASERYGQAQARYQSVRGLRRRQSGTEAGYVAGENFSFQRNQLGRQQNLGALQANSITEAATFEEMIQRRRELREAGVSAAEAEAKARQANLQVMQAELSVLQQREQRLSSAASRIGSMNVLDQMMGIAAARQVAANGIENTSPEVRDRARSFAPEWYNQQATQYGEQTEAYRAGRAEGFLPPGTESIASTRDQMANLQQQIREGTIASERQMATTIADVLGRALEQIGPILEERIALALRRLQTGRAIQNNQLN